MEDRRPIELADLHFYFDSQSKDRLDVSGPARRSSEVIALRERLMALPDHDFDAAIRTIQKLVENSRPQTQREKLEEERAERETARQLFERTEPITGGTGGVDKISEI